MSKTLPSTQPSKNTMKVGGGGGLTVTAMAIYCVLLLFTSARFFYYLLLFLFTCSYQWTSTSTNRADVIGGR